MPRYVAFLRGINLGHRRIKMDRLRALFRKLDFEEVETLIASGNVLFTAPARDERLLTQLIECHLAQSLGYAVDTFIRTRDEIATIAAFKPFSDADLENTANTIHVGLLKEPLAAKTARELTACRTEVDEFFADAREFYWLCRIRSSDSKVWASRQMKAVALPSATLRNLKTLRKLSTPTPISVV